MIASTRALAPTAPGPASAYFDLQASWGITKHFGGIVATDTLLAHCGVNASARLLEVGCGVGSTPCHAAQALGCRVVAVDRSAQMLAWARRRILRLGLESRVRLAGADAQALPFPDSSFDAVICESVLAFVPDPARALAEYARVVRPGGCVGVAEGVWLKPPPPALEGYLERALGGARFLTVDGWADLLAGAGLTIVAAERHRSSALEQWRAEYSHRDAADLRDYARAWRTFATGLAASAPLRRYIRAVWPSSLSIFRVFDSFGYGICVGKKGAHPC